jgi:hypothetical protein
VGRILEEHQGLRGEVPQDEIRQTYVPQGFIACTSGFLIN